MVSNGIIFTPNFMKIGLLVQKLRERIQPAWGSHRLTFFLEKEKYAKNECRNFK